MARRLGGSVDALGALSLALAGQGFFLLAAIGLVSLHAVLAPADVQVDLFGGLGLGGSDIALGLALAGALVGAMRAAIWAMPGPMGQLEETVVELFSRFGLSLSWPTVFLLAAAAGICEEALFRGALQGLVAGYAPTLLAVVGVSGLFGLAHAVSWGYFLAAFTASLLLGGVYAATGSLTAVMLAHGLYDVWALGRIRRRMARAAASAS